MFEAHVLHLLRKYLGEYVHGLSSEALRISVWKGDVVLKDLKLKAEALNALRLPVTVKAGFVGAITLKVPWKSLGKEPVIVLIDRVFLLAQPSSNDGVIKEEDRDKLFEAKLQQIEEAESATIEAISRSKLGSPPPGNSWLGSLIATIIGNLKITISNVHIRYEDSVSNSQHPFCSGVTLAKLAAVTTDERGNETFDTSGALDRLRKSLHLERFAVYHDSDSLPWEIEKSWEGITPKEWVEIFEDGINEPSAKGCMASKWALNRSYLVSPINGILKYHRLGKQERNDPEVPFEKASLTLSDVSLTVTEAQYRDLIKFMEVVSRYKTYVEVCHLRPSVSVSEAPFLWWRYAAVAGLQQKKLCYRFSWDQIRHLCQLRRQYVQLYVALLQHSPSVDRHEMREIEKDLDSKVILLWRLLAHAKVESEKSKEAAEKKKLQKSSWFSFGWRASMEEASDEDSPGTPQLAEERLTKDEWQAINKLLSFQPDEEMSSNLSKESQNMIQFMLTVSIGQAAAKIIDINQSEILCGRFEQLQVSTKFKHRSIYCDVLLRFYGLSAPEGSLAQSAFSEQKVNALAASFVHFPVGENIDWKLSATISPCHVTVLIDSVDRFLEFMKRSNAVSPTVALETANALQLKIEKVTRRAQEQFQMVMEEKSRFALDIDLDAPKVRVPMRATAASRCDSHFTLDFGHFTLKTMENQSDDQNRNLYSRFYISGRDIAAFFTDCGSDIQSCNLVKTFHDGLLCSPREKESKNFYSLIDRCGIAVVANQIKMPHPSYPSTRVSFQVPNLGIHFSPERFSRLIELFNILKGKMESCSQPVADDVEAKITSWKPPEFSVEARILVWKGIGNSVATWQPCYIMLSGLYLYLLDSVKSQSYNRYLSMAGKQVHEVPPMNVGGSRYCIAISLRGMDTQKALESSSTWIVDFRDAEEKTIWLKRLIKAIYQASAPPSVNALTEANDKTTSPGDSTTKARSADLVINGALVETRLFLYGKARDNFSEGIKESLILEFIADGGKVHITQVDNDLTVKSKLHSLTIKDELQRRLSKGEQYLAMSVLKNGSVSTPHCKSGDYVKDLSSRFLDDEDNFTDALPDFMSLPEADSNAHDTDFGCYGMMGLEADFGSAESLFHVKELELEKISSSEVFYEATGSNYSDFVSVDFSTRSSDSVDYNGIDTQMSMRMSKLEFFCNRPTILALIGFGLDLSHTNNAEVSADSNLTSNGKPLMDKEKLTEAKPVRGLLGFGKERVVFYLNMNVDSVTVFLNKEDGSQLGTLVQETFLLDLKVHPSSLSIEGTLGNFRLCDTSLGLDHCWDWLCDVQNPGVDSLIQFKFNSYSAEDDDYQGYQYSLQGQLNAVRIVFLYRFVQEITVYFMQLASNETEEAVKLVDKVGGFEWLIKKCDMDGATAVKLDLSLDTPIIIVPKNSTSKDFIQLDLGQLCISNELIWYGSREQDPSAVHVDVLHAKILGINMSVGIDGCVGKPMIREGQGLDIFVRRSLRDVFRTVPSFSLEVMVDSLYGVMSDKEYKVIMDCSCMNLSEEPRLPSSFRDGKSGPKDTMKQLADKVNMNSQLLLARTVTIMTVSINNASFELCNTIDEESPLAHISLEDLWVSYRMTSMSEMDLYVTVPIFTVLDVRPDTKPEMRLMLGSSTDVSKQSLSGKVPFSANRSCSRRTNSESGFDLNTTVSTMFVMDFRCRASSQSFVIRVQQPRVLVVPDFLLAVCEFFVPGLRAITGREETMDSKNDPICKNDSIILKDLVYRQEEDIVHLSPSKQLIANCVGVDEYTYDGCGKTIYLSDETDAKEMRCNRYQPIIFIGRGKRLRFVNVKIENGFLLRKYTYLSNESSYSVSVEDAVDIVLLEKSSSEDEKSLDCKDDSSNLATEYRDSDSNLVPSFTFETQVVSPDFTFYDGTKSSMDDSSHGEKLLRAKLDLSFVYASKGNDTWIRTLVKDFTVEAGSGLVILDPVDISGGYTFVKDKTSMSLVSSDIYVHLSLSALSLILNLQSQATAALNLGNAMPLHPCTNFDRIWVSKNVNGSNLTFWRARPPANYVILGDCVTSRPVPPSQAVMSVSNTYGRVRKPIGFDLIGPFEGVLGDEDQFVKDCKISLWMPIAPPGYQALGCVANVGDRPPANHIIYCLRSDLVTSTRYAECLVNAPPNTEFDSGFSIWRLDNVIGSFFAHFSTDYPPQGQCFDLNDLLMLNLDKAQRNSLGESVSSENAGHDGENQLATQKRNTSGWDILRTVSKATSCYISTPNFERIWWDKGNDLRQPVSIWRPIARSGYAILGDCITEGLEPPALGIIFRSDSPNISAKPIHFTRVAQIVGKGMEEAFFWYPTAPPGYASLGCVVSRTDEAPSLDLFCCPRIDLVSKANILEVPLSRSSISKPPQCWSIWKIDNQACTFLAREDLKKPSSRLAYTIGDSVKPKTRENVNAEVKLSCFSVTVLDSLCGMMTPLFDITIANIKLATHGRMDAMNAVLISSIAASTFNAQLESWEPLVEPFDGIFKFETYDANSHPPSRLGKRVRIAATSIVNINVSAANLETFVGSILSWRRQLELEKKASKINEDVCHQGQDQDATFSPLDEDDLQTVVVENKLGCDIYIKKVEQNTDTVDQLHHGDYSSVWIPPPRFSDRLNVVDDCREARYYVAIQILEAKGLPLVNDGNCHNFFCALRLNVDSQTADQQKLFPQSARTKCVKPSISKINDLEEGTVKWNELFIFEVPRKAPAKLEVEVTNLSAKAGKGNIVGALSVPVGHGANTLRKVASVRMLHQPSDLHNIGSYTLRRKVMENNAEGMHESGSLMVSTFYFERKSIANLQKDKIEDDLDRDIGFWVGLGPGSAWEGIRSLLPISVVPKSLQNEYLALEVEMKNGKKHAILRGLVTVVNDSDVKLVVSVCHESLVRGDNTSSRLCWTDLVTEEVFENQRYQESSGWSSHARSHDDPGCWSTRNNSYSSADFFEPPLPHGWQWASGWTIDKSQLVDNDGWTYAPNFKCITWPPTSLKSCTKSSLDNVRQRRLVRTRKQIFLENGNFGENYVTIIDPGASAVLPWKSTAKSSDQCLQVSPFLDTPPGPYSWGRALASGSGYVYGKDQLLFDQGSRLSSNFAFSLNQIEKKDLLLCCHPSSQSKVFWLSMDTDASVLHTELNVPVYDWRISINSPMKLENRLPCTAEFTIWDKTKEGNLVEQQQGVISSRRSVNIYTADIEKPLYLTLCLHGGWIMEKEPVLILDPACSHLSSFWMVHQTSKRRLRVSVEHDSGGTTCAPKSVRLFVPYWIVNESPLPLVYRVVEVEPLENMDTDSGSLSRTRSARSSFRHPISSMDRRLSSSRKNSQVLEVIEDTSPIPCMFSPLHYSGRSGVMLSQSHKDGYLSPRVGISIGMSHSEIYSPGISILDLENKERVDVKACSAEGSYHKLSALVKLTSHRTKVVHFQPHTVFINRAGCRLCLQQCDSQSVTWIQPADAPKTFEWQSSAKVELLKLRVNGYQWSTPFSVCSEGIMRISLKKENGDEQLHIRVVVRSGAKSSRFEVVFRLNTFSSPYRIENRSFFFPIRFRQVDGRSDSWQLLLPNAAASFLWEDLGRRHFLEVLVDGDDPHKSEKYDIDQISDHPLINVTDGPAKALRVTIIKEDKVNVVKISDWMPDNEPSGSLIGQDSSSAQISGNSSAHQQSISVSDCEFHVVLELADLGISVVDHTPEEILYLSVQNLLLSYSTGLGSGISRFKLRMRGLQVDNQLPLTPMPVIFRPQKIGEETDYILKFSMTFQSNGSLDLSVYPYIGLHGPESSAFLINIHEPIIWRIHEMIQRVDLSRMNNKQTTAVSFDPIVQIGVLNISEIRFKVSMGMSPSQRPRGVLGFWSSLMTALGNTENMAIRINQKFHQSVCMRQSSMISMAISNIRKDLLSQPLQLLSGVDILGNASSALGHMSKGVAALSMDRKFIQSRQRQENKGVEDIGDVIREGGGAFAKGLFRGVTGILTKPLEGAKTSGVEGFVQGVGKGIIGAAAQPVSGVLDLLSKTTEGANAVRMKIASAITSDEQLLRRRLPRVIGGDNLLRPYIEYKAQGQVILQLAESGSFLGQVDLFKVRGKFALSDAYEDHFVLPKGKILMVTHRRVILLQQPAGIVAQRKFSPVRDPCSILWDVLWDDLATIELTHGKKDRQKAPPSRVIIYLQTKSTDWKDCARVVKCNPETRQALEVYASIEQTMHTYRPISSKDVLRNSMRKPYSPTADTANSTDISKEGACLLSPQQMPASVHLTSTFGSSTQ